MKIKYGIGESLKALVAAVAAIAVFTVVLFSAVISLGASEREIKTAPGAPDSLVSAGAPRSQLELKRMFESMSKTYSEGGNLVYEPVSSEYRGSIDERVANGERPMLSVEEILFIISDSAAAYDGYDVIRFRSADGRVERDIVTAKLTETDEKPFHRAALDRIAAVTELIEYRIGAMSAPDSFLPSADGSGNIEYYPRGVERSDGGDSSERSFVFGLHAGEENYSRAVVFCSEDGNEVALYPSSEELELCCTKVILPNGIAATGAESEKLLAAGCEPSRCRNITPLYWLTETDMRLFVYGGRMILVDPSIENAVFLLPEAYRLTSAAMAHSGEQGETELYFTASFDGESSVWRYSRGAGEPVKLFESDGEYLAVTEPLFGDYRAVKVYAASRRDDERFITALECNGEPLAKYFVE